MLSPSLQRTPVKQLTFFCVLCHPPFLPGSQRTKVGFRHEPLQMKLNLRVLITVFFIRGVWTRERMSYDKTMRIILRIRVCDDEAPIENALNAVRNDIPLGDIHELTIFGR